MAREPDCNEVVELVTAYLEGALPGGEIDAFERHLERCTGCGNYVEQIRIAIERIGRVQPEDLPTQMRESLVAAFRDWRAA